MSDEFRLIDRSQHELLIVDDDPASRYATARLLANAGFRIREASTGAEGMQLADASISAMVLDVHLPDIDGFDLCRKLRLQPQTARLPVLHLTAAYVTDNDKVRGLDAGADAYLTHPVEPAVLVATVQALVRTRVAEEAMRRSEEKFKAIYAQAPCGICLLDEQGRFVDVNPALLTMLAQRASAVLGRTVQEFVAAEGSERAEVFTRGLQGPRSCELPLLEASGNVLHTEWTISPHVEPGLSMAIVIDVSQRVLLAQQRQQLLEGERSARSEAERMTRMKDDLIAVLSHELRTPLNAIMGWTHVLQKRVGTPELARGLEAIERNGTVQARIISDILDMSRLNLGKMPMSFEAIDPAQVLRSALDALRPALDEKRLALRLDVAEPYHPIVADGARLQQVVWNLISNAIKFSAPAGEITVSLHEEADGVRLTVTDEGAGIDAEFLPFVFDRFAQSSAARNRAQGGLGLGLAIVKHLVEAHGGQVGVSSAGKDRGTTFTVWLPRSLPASLVEAQDLAAAELQARPAATQATLEGLDLLLVDDDREATAMLKIIVEDQGGQARVAHDVEQALSLMAKRQPDVLVCDIGMPGRSGYDLMRTVRSREAASGRHLAAIALTSFSRDKDREEAFASGFDAHCAKPVRPLQLMLEIERAVTAARARDERPAR